MKGEQTTGHKTGIAEPVYGAPPCHASRAGVPRTRGRQAVESFKPADLDRRLDRLIAETPPDTLPGLIGTLEGAKARASNA